MLMTSFCYFILFVKCRKKLIGSQIRLTDRASDEPALARQKSYL